MKKIKQFFNLTKKELILCSIAGIITTLLGVQLQFIGLLSFTLMGNIAYKLVKSETARKHKAEFIVTTVCCITLCVVGAGVIYYAVGKASLCGCLGGLFVTIVMGESSKADGESKADNKVG